MQRCFAKLIVCLMSFSLVGFGNSFVLCVETDQKVSIERSFAGACGDLEASQLKQISATQNLTDLSVPCDSCTDIPIVTAVENTRHDSDTFSVSPAILATDFTAISVITHPLSICDFALSRVIPFVAFTVVRRC